MKRFLFVLVPLALAQGTFAAERAFVWPDGVKAAVSLAYDDALHSQLDHAIPALNRHGLKGSFYLTLSADSVVTRLAQWRAAAAIGHELGNHTLFHQCSGKLPGRDWINQDNDLDLVRATQLAAQIRVGNTLLQAIDGRTERTFTAPCGDLKAGGENYLPLITADFVAIKSLGGEVIPDMKTLDPYAVAVVVPVDMSGAQLIERVQAAGAQGTMINFTFHGIGSEYLTISETAHEELLEYLAAHRDIYWTDTFVNIMKHVKAEQKRIR